MGFELDRLMKQYGVATPSLNYSGTGVPIDPGVRPVATDALKGDDLTKAQANYDNLLSKYNLDKANYPADRALYDTYKTEYQNRMLGTPQYMQAQFQTGNEPKSDAYKYVTNPKFDAATGQGMGVKQFNTNLQNWAIQNPTANTAAINAYADKYGISAQDIYNATNNRWGNTLQVPKYGTLSPTITTPVTSIVGGGGNDSVVTSITGGTGNDLTTIVGGAGNDTVVGGGNNDIVVDTTVGGTGNDVIADDGTTDSILSTIATLNGGTGNDVIADDGTTAGIQDVIDGLNNQTVLADTTSILNNIADKKDTQGYVDITGGDGTTITQGPLNTTTAFDFLGNATPKTGVVTISDETGGTNTGAVNTTADTVADTNTGLTNLANQYDDAQDDGTTEGIVNQIDAQNLIRDYRNDLGLYVGNVSDSIYGPTANLGYSNNPWATPTYGSSGGFGGGGAKPYDDWSSAAFAKGGPVKTHFQTGGANQPSEIDQMAENYGVAPQPDIMSYQGSKLFPMQAPAPVSDQMTRRDAYPETPQQPMDARATQLDALLRRYAGDSTDYSAELAEARKRSDSESMAFQKMIQTAMKGSADEAPSKAEMYFRLASAFGSPTKTGHFAEALGNVNKELASYSKEERDAKKAQRALQLQLGLKGQEMRMASAKDELATIKTLAAEGMKDKRAITAEVIKDFIKSGEPESAAGKQAKDEGLKVGTPEFKARVNEIAQTSIDAKLAQVTSTLAGMSVQQANLALAQSKFQNQQTQQAKLSPAEMKLKTEVEDILTSTDQAMLDLKRAYQLNPNTFDTSLGDVAQRKVLETAGVKDPKVTATREQANLLSKSAVGKLKTAFGGNPTEGERKILLDMEGIDAKSKEERAIIMRNSYMALKARREREQKRLNEINQGLYRDTSAPTGELE